jgi:large subunit ribosomal protein L7e
MPEVFVSNYMKQQRNFVKYRRQKNETKDVEDKQSVSLPKSQRVSANSLILAVRIKQSTNTTPQAQKILKELGLKQINNCALFSASSENMQKLLTVVNYVAYGTPTKKIVDDLLRKRGYMRGKDSKRVPISDNVLVEELLGESAGCICVEDVIEALWKCNKDAAAYEAVRKQLWPIQLTPLVEMSDKANVAHEATGRQVTKKTTRTAKGGYLGFMGAEINDFVA